MGGSSGLSISPIHVWHKFALVLHLTQHWLDIFAAHPSGHSGRRLSRVYIFIYKPLQLDFGGSTQSL